MAEFEQRALVGGAGAVALATSRAAAFYEALGYVGGAVYFKKWLTGTHPLPDETEASSAASDRV